MKDISRKTDGPGKEEDKKLQKGERTIIMRSLSVSLMCVYYFVKD